ncbi:cellulose synthase-like protein e1-like, partial [Trifolium pratense]
MGRGRVVYRLFAISLFVAISLIWLHRFNHIITTNHTQQEEEDDGGIWVWLGLLGAELWFGFYWILTQAFRWNQLVFRHPFKNRLSQ